MKEMTYAESGVDIKKEEKAIKGMLSSIKTQRKGIGKPLGGHYAGMIEFGEYALVLCTDGVGSKVKIASELKKWDTVGIDCIAMNVNDAICVGAEPLAFVDYLAIDDPKPAITKEIGKGLEKGAKQSNISIIGGETASLPEVVNGFDLAGTCLAVVNKNEIITGKSIVPGDIIIVEGLFTLYWENLRGLFHKRVFVNLNDHICLSRRIERDTKERGRSRESVLTQYAETVRPMNEKYILPTKTFADIVVNGEDPLDRSTALIMVHINSTINNNSFNHQYKTGDRR